MFLVMIVSEIIMHEGLLLRAQIIHTSIDEARGTPALQDAGAT